MFWGCFGAVLGGRHPKNAQKRKTHVFLEHIPKLQAIDAARASDENVSGVGFELQLRPRASLLVESGILFLKVMPNVIAQKKGRQKEGSPWLIRSLFGQSS